MRIIHNPSISETNPNRKSMKMNLNTFHGIVLVILVGVQACLCCRVKTGSIYVYCPSKDQLNNEDFHLTVRESLRKLDVAKRTEKGESVTDILGKAVGSEKTTEVERNIYRALLSLQEYTDSCSSELANVYLSVLAQAGAGSGLSLFYNFLREHGPKKMTLCAHRTNKEFQSNPVEPAAAQDFNQVLRQTLGLKPDDRTFKLYDRLKDLNVADQEFHVERMVEAVRKLDNRPDDDKLDGFAILTEFMDKRCGQFNEDPLSTTLNIISWALEYGGDQADIKYDPELLMLREYRRICFAWKKPRTSFSMSPLERNIRKQLDSSLKTKINKIIKKLDTTTQTIRSPGRQ